MGTNYYWKGKPAEVCPTCGHSEEQEVIHIGNCSYGWCFSLHVSLDEEDGIPMDLDDWKILFSEPGSTIEDEYGDHVSPEEMISIITERRWNGDVPRVVERPLENEVRVNNLLSSKVDGRHCIGHGEGPWDYIIGDFS
jgi:hypothetical protein